ncbi:MAG: hypothetical protein PHV45_05540 [Desulfuromonas thiophila]|nr:hypothetical protein [Desulfuromonas thiophila]
MRGKLILLAIVALLLGGCASKKPYPYNPKDSFALNTMRAAGAQVIRDNKLPPGDTMLVDVALQGTLGAAGTLSSVANISSGLAGGLWALEGLFSSKKDMECFPFIFGWEPKDGLPDKETLSAINAHLVQATAAAHKNTDWPDGYTPDTISVNSVSTSRFAVNGPVCSGEYLCNYYVGGALPLKKARTPEHLAANQMFSFVSRIPQTTITKKERKLLDFNKFPNVLPDVEFYLEVSKNLPPTYFIYLPPSDGMWPRFSMKKPDGTFDLLRAPVLLNQGKIFLFAKPEA